MELLLIVVIVGALVAGGGLAGYDSRPRLDDEPHRAI
jgi:hypothetical protein